MTSPSLAIRSHQLLGAWGGGDEGALGRLIPLVQPELHRLAHHYMTHCKPSRSFLDSRLISRRLLIT